MKDLLNYVAFLAGLTIALPLAGCVGVESQSTIAILPIQAPQKATTLAQKATSASREQQRNDKAQKEQ